MITARGRTGWRDGGIHTDSTSKVATVLVYLNGIWEKRGGRLRLLRSRNLEDYLTEISPDGGTMVAFLNQPNALHGHRLHIGRRRAIQLNWVTHEAIVERELRRHARSAAVKKWKRQAIAKLIPGMQPYLCK